MRILTEDNQEDLIILTTVCETVTDFSPMVELKANMFSTMRDANGCGLAAPQVGLSQRILIMIKSDGEVLFMVNPIVTKKSSMRMQYKEGCLSMKNFSVTTNRSRQVTLSYHNEHNIEQTTRLGSVDAVVLQHELDHLDGKLMDNWTRK